MTAVRRTQAERSASTRALLISAAIDSLNERGWAATTSVGVCARAGLTRGAFVHHFDSLPELLAAALQSIYEDSPEPVGPRPATLAEAVDATWHAIANRHFKAVIEAWLAMANDPELAAVIGPVVAEFAGRVNPKPSSSDVLGTAERRAYYLMAREAMLGLALGRATNHGKPLGHEGAVLKTLRAGAARIDNNDR